MSPVLSGNRVRDDGVLGYVFDFKGIRLITGSTMVLRIKST